MSTLPFPSAPTPKSSNKDRFAVNLSSYWLTLLAIVLVLSLTRVSSAQTASSISSTSGPVSWDFGPVVAGTVTNVGIQDTCPPGVCDNHDLTITLPAPAATFYQTNTVQVTIKYTWNSTASAACSRCARIRQLRCTGKYSAICRFDQCQSACGRRAFRWR